MSNSSLENKFITLWINVNSDLILEPEICFLSTRKFRYDFVHRHSKTAFEINGGLYLKSGHTSAAGILRDYEKINLAQLAGWSIFLLANKKITREYLEQLGEFCRQKCTEDIESHSGKGFQP